MEDVSKTSKQGCANVILMNGKLRTSPRTKKGFHIRSEFLRRIHIRL